ncbi:MAG: glycoside hydrolase family 28 protein [Eubacteriales bacterium]|nr:glycoside hydrolase family 28 protein [Eubacteriales bacterium]
MNLFHYTDPDTVCLWWEKPETGALWEILLNGEKAGQTEKTHFLLRDLTPDTGYEIQVRPPDGGPGARLHLRTPAARPRIVVTDGPYFAKGDGESLDTAALQRAIDDCPPGGSVVLPAGTFRSGALRLHSHMELYLEAGATLLGSQRPEDYLPRIWSRFEGREMLCCQSLLNLGTLDHSTGPSCRDVVIRGSGVIQGGGYELAWATIEQERQRLKDYLDANAAYIATCENADTIPGRVRGRLINMSNCQNVRISGLTLAQGPSWNVHMIYSDNIVTDHCTFRSQGIWNGDGWDPDSSENCTIFSCLFYTGDDSVAIKSGKNPEGNVIGRPTRRIRVFDCRCAFGHGLCIGSEMSGGVEDVKIWDCDLENSMVGIQIKGTRKRGGYVRDITVRDCVVPCILVGSVGYNDDGEGAPEPPVFRDFRYAHLRITGRSLDRDWSECPAVELHGFAGSPLRNVSLEDVTVTGGTGIRMSRCENVTIEMRAE